MAWRSWGTSIWEAKRPRSFPWLSLNLDGKTSAMATSLMGPFLMPSAFSTAPAPLLSAVILCAHPPAQPGRGAGRGGPQAPAFVSPEVQADRHVVFRVYAPQAQNVRLSGGDIPGNTSGATFTKGDNGVWE